MPNQKKYRCPVCKKVLTKKEYERALHIHKERQARLQDWEGQLRKKERNLDKKVKAAREDGRKAEKQKAARMVKGYKEKLRRMQERMKQLESGTTPQTEGLADEVKLTNRLRQEFPGDIVDRKGHAGDVLHTVRDNGQVAGVIIFECKRTPTLKNSHVRQAYRNKQTRHADFAVLVTTGNKKGFGGLAEISGVLVVSPLGVVSLADLLRQHLIALLRAGIERNRRAKIANQLLRFIKSADFRNPIEEVVRTASELEEGVKKEFDWHMNDWRRRVLAYRRIEWDGSAVEENVKRVLHGAKPRRLEQPKTPLLLPGTILEANRGTA